MYTVHIPIIFIIITVCPGFCFFSTYIYIFSFVKKLHKKSIKNQEIRSNEIEKSDCKEGIKFLEVLKFHLQVQFKFH